MITVHVDLAERSYPIYIESGVLAQLGHYLKTHHLDERVFVITDDRVRELYEAPLLTTLKEMPQAVHVLSVPPGETSKSLHTANQLYTQLLEHRADRKCVIVAFGGGVVGDLAGFVAATFMRGVRFVQVPTTILAQVDSSVGGKVGINHPLGKNLIGAFYQPQFVLIDPETLKTLDERQIRAGSAEIIKYGFIRDRQFYDDLVSHLDSFLALQNIDLLNYALQRSCEIKAEVVSQDEKESGVRAILNFGHTLGHALEAVTRYNTFLHGEAIIHGMKAALYLSHLSGYLAQETVLEACSHLTSFKAPHLPADISHDALFDAMQQDKKRSSKGQLWVLLKEMGHAVMTREVSDSHVEQAIDFMIEQSASA